MDIIILGLSQLKACQESAKRALFILKENNCQTIPPGTSNMFYILVIHTDNAQVSFLLIALSQPGGAVVNFSKSPQNIHWIK